MPLHLLVLAILCFGLSSLVWGAIGAVRSTVRGALGLLGDGVRTLRRRPGSDDPEAILRLLVTGVPPAPVDRLARVAILIAAHNEEAVIEKTLNSARRLVPAHQIFVASDGSSDATATIGRSWGANVLDLQPNRGKAGALSAAVRHFAFESFADYVVLLDADTELAPDYFSTALPLFEDPEVAVVAGRASTQWHPKELGWPGKILVAHRERLYFLVQRLQKYGQAAAGADVVAIAPGFASIYRADVIAQIDMDPPGLVIEDFNMTFEVHRRKLGRIQFEPSAAVAYTQDPSTLRDYRKQVLRWSLGFWQTVRWHRSGVAGKFRIAVGLYCAEMVLGAASLLAVPVLLAAGIAVHALHSAGVDVPAVGWLPQPLALVAVVAAPDLLLSALCAAAQRRVLMLALAPAFLVMRVVDAWLCLRALKRAFGPPSSGVWTSPARRVDGSSIAS